MGSVFRQRRKFLRLTQEYVAEKASISLPYYDHIERGMCVASISTVRKLCEILRVSADRALGVKNIRPHVSDEHIDESHEFNARFWAEVWSKYSDTEQIEK